MRFVNFILEKNEFLFTKKHKWIKIWYTFYSFKMFIKIKYKESSGMNLLVSLNRSYLEQLSVLISSISLSNPNENFDIYVMSRDLIDEDLNVFRKKFSNFQFFLILITDKEIATFPVVEKRYPVEIYFRLFASVYLPKNMNRILYLDTDIVVINSLKPLYNMDFSENYFIGTTHVKNAIHKFHEVRLDMKKDNIYLNTGVLLMNLEKLRNIPVEEEVKDFVFKNKNRLMLPDQDIISALYGDKVILVSDILYNLGERGYRLYNMRNKENIDLDWIRKNTVIIHYYGRNKPWKKKYYGELDIFYKEILNSESYAKNV